MDTRVGCIYALQRIMQDSSRDQSAIIAVLCAYVRDHAPIGTTDPRSSTPSHPGTDVQAALTVIGSRPLADEHPAAIDLDHTQLAGAVLNGDFTGADLDRRGPHRRDAGHSTAQSSPHRATSQQLAGANRQRAFCPVTGGITAVAPLRSVLAAGPRSSASALTRACKRATVLDPGE